MSSSDRFPHPRSIPAGTTHPSVTPLEVTIHRFWKAIEGETYLEPVAELVPPEADTQDFTTAQLALVLYGSQAFVARLLAIDERKPLCIDEIRRLSIIQERKNEIIPQDASLDYAAIGRDLVLAYLERYGHDCETNHLRDLLFGLQGRLAEVFTVWLGSARSTVLDDVFRFASVGKEPFDSLSAAIVAYVEYLVANLGETDLNKELVRSQVILSTLKGREYDVRTDEEVAKEGAKDRVPIVFDDKEFSSAARGIVLGYLEHMVGVGRLTFEFAVIMLSERIQGLQQLQP